MACGTRTFILRIIAHSQTHACAAWRVLCVRRNLCQIEMLGTPGSAQQHTPGATGPAPGHGSRFIVMAVTPARLYLFAGQTSLEVRQYTKL